MTIDAPAPQHQHQAPATGSEAGKTRDHLWGHFMIIARDGLNGPHHPKSPSTAHADASIGGSRLSRGP
jgi:hypothetical protein